MHPHTRRLSLQLYYSTQTQSTSWNLRCSPSQPSAAIRRTYATVSSENVDNGKPLPPLKNPYPYPRHSSPTPHQIFHLRAGATQAEIKARYYDLVKSHHPDSQFAAHLDSDVAHSRFRSIQASYDFLRGRTISPHPNARPTPSSQGFDPYMHEMARRRRAYYANRRPNEHETENDDASDKSGWREGFGAHPGERTIWHEDGWRERLIFSLGVVTLLAGLFPSMPTTIASTFLPPSTPTSPYVPPYKPSSASGGSSNTSAPATPDGQVAPSNTANSFSLPFSVDLDKGHRKAVSALVQVRTERQELGAQRRDGMRKRVKEMATAEATKSDEQTVSQEEGGDNVSPMISSAEEAEAHSQPPDTN